MSSHEYRLIDPFDIFLLVAIGQGVNSCTYLANVTGNSKQMVSTRVKVLEKYGLTSIEDVNQKYFTREYNLTPLGQELVSKTFFNINADYLHELKNKRKV